MMDDQSKPCTVAELINKYIPLAQRREARAALLQIGTREALASAATIHVDPLDEAEDGGTWH